MRPTSKQRGFGIELNYEILTRYPCFDTNPGAC